MPRPLFPDWPLSHDYMPLIPRLVGVAPLMTEPPPANSTNLHIVHNPDTHSLSFGQPRVLLYGQNKDYPPPGIIHPDAS